MKKLSKQELTRLIHKEYMISNFELIYKRDNKNEFFIVYPYSMVKIWFSEYGWNFSIFGEVSYVYSKLYVNLIKLLDSEYYMEKKQ